MESDDEKAARAPPRRGISSPGVMPIIVPSSAAEMGRAGVHSAVQRVVP